MQIVNTSSPDETRTLVGVMETKMSMGKQLIKFDLSDGELTCLSEQIDSNWQRGWMRNRLRTSLNFKCDDGRTGKAQLALSGTNSENWSGTGTGKFNDGSKIRVLVGDMLGSIDWD